jgi:hypothetical protein
LVTFFAPAKKVTRSPQASENSVAATRTNESHWIPAFAGMTSEKSATNTMRLDDPRKNPRNDQQYQKHRQPDPPRQRLHRAIRRAFIAHHVKQTRTEVVNDHDEKSDDDNRGSHEQKPW